MDQNLEREIEELKETIKNLQSEIDRKKDADRERLRSTLKGSFWIGRKGATLFLGNKLSEAIKKLFEEIKKGQVSSEVLSEVVTYTFLRFVRVGLWGLFISLIPIGLVLIQTYLLKEQNNKLELQNTLINTQSQLLETDRRSSLVFLMSNIMDKVDSEINDTIKSGVKAPELSPQLKGRIIALSRSFRSYRYFDFVSKNLSDRLISPERGHLLVALYESGISNRTLEEILQRGSFEYADLSGASIKGIELDSANLSYSFFTGSKLNRLYFRGSNLIGSSFNGSADLEMVEYDGANLSYSSFSSSSMRRGKFIRTPLDSVSFQGCNYFSAEFLDVHFDHSNDFKDGVFKFSTFEKSSFQHSNLQKTDWERSKFNRTEFLHTNMIGTNFRSVSFTNCTFDNCNFSKSNLRETTFLNTELFKVDFDSALVVRPDWFQLLPVTSLQKDSLNMRYEIVLCEKCSEKPSYYVIQKK